MKKMILLSSLFLSACGEEPSGPCRDSAALSLGATNKAVFDFSDDCSVRVNFENGYYTGVFKFKKDSDGYESVEVNILNVVGAVDGFKEGLHRCALTPEPVHLFCISGDIDL